MIIDHCRSGLVVLCVRPSPDGVPYIIKKIEHKFGMSGFTTAIDATLYDGQSSKGKTSKTGESGKSSGSASDSGSLAINAPEGTPASSLQQSIPCRSGITDAN